MAPRRLLDRLCPPGVVVLGAALALLATVGADTTVCFEKVSDVPAIYMQEHPVGNVLAVGTQDGLIKLIVRPPVQSGALATNYSTFLDLTKRVHFDGEMGLLSFAFHPHFAKNGRFFASYICDAQKHPECQGPCACSVHNNCTATAIACPYNTIVAEYSAGPSPLQALSLNSTEVRRIVKFGRPGPNHNGGQIWFGTDGLLYIASGDGFGSADAGKISAQNGEAPLGKILRISVDAAEGEVIGQSTYGIYGVPSDNPFVNNTQVMPEVFALGFRNPWRCSEDPITKSIFCGDIGQASTQEANLVLPGGNYGWPYYDGSQRTLDMNVLPKSSYYPPTLEYEAPPSNQGQGIIGGYVYRAQRNACLQGRYLFGDNSGYTYAGSPYNDNTTVENVQILIAPTPTKQMISKEGLVESLPFPDGDSIFSWGEDKEREVYRLSSTGIYRVIDSSICGGPCDGKIQLYGSGKGAEAGALRSGAMFAFAGLLGLLALAL